MGTRAVIMGRVVAERSETVVYAVSTAGHNRSSEATRDHGHFGPKVLEVDSHRLASTFVQILNEFRQRYLLTYTPSQPPAPGWHRIDVRVKKRGATVKTRAGYHVRRR